VAEASYRIASDMRYIRELTRIALIIILIQSPLAVSQSGTDADLYARVLHMPTKVALLFANEMLREDFLVCSRDSRSND
jgi:hypothetical protein